MKRVLAVCLCMVLLACSAAPAFAANKDLVVTKDTSINPSFVKYGNITVKSGATLTIKSTSGFEITGALTVEPGAALISDGEGKGQFNFAMKGRGSSISGIPLYFRSRDDGLVSLGTADLGIKMNSDSYTGRRLIKKGDLAAEAIKNEQKAPANENAPELNVNKEEKKENIIQPA